MKAPLRAYFDAGEARPNDIHTFYMGGYVSTTTQWTAFAKKWRTFLRRNDLNAFHMTDFVARRGPYRDWSDAHRTAAMVRAIDLTVATVRFGVATAILRSEYDALPVAEQRLIGTPYGLCASIGIARVAWKLRQAGYEAPVAYIFEHGDRGQGAVRVALEELLSRKGYREKYMVHSLTFEPKRLPGLQIADLLAFEMGRFVPRVVLGADDTPLRKNFQRLLDEIHHEGILLDAKALRERIAARQRVETKGSVSSSLSYSGH